MSNHHLFNERFHFACRRFLNHLLWKEFHFMQIYCAAPLIKTNLTFGKSSKSFPGCPFERNIPCCDGILIFFIVVRVDPRGRTQVNGMFATMCKKGSMHSWKVFPWAFWVVGGVRDSSLTHCSPTYSLDVVTIWPIRASGRQQPRNISFCFFPRTPHHTPPPPSPRRNLSFS